MPGDVVVGFGGRRESFVVCATHIGSDDFLPTELTRLITLLCERVSGFVCLTDGDDDGGVSGASSTSSSTNSLSERSHVFGSWSGLLSSSWQSGMMGRGQAKIRDDLSAIVLYALSFLAPFAANMLAVPQSGGEDGSSMSDVSGVSCGSNKTYIAEESSLVLEAETEDGNSRSV